MTKKSKKKDKIVKDRELNFPMSSFTLRESEANSTIDDEPEKGVIYSAGYMIYQVSLRWQRHLRIALESTGLTYPQFIVLSSIHFNEETETELTQQSIASITAMDKMMISQMLEALEKKKYISRTQGKSDSRSKAVKITKAGTDWIETYAHTVLASDQEFFDRLGKKSEIFMKSLSKLYKQANKIDTDTTPVAN
ncbi:MAG: MarR family winged helix-turn-helix transcriptional regulator [Bacteroidota bacterium]|nr:MarR family winged helix-turn-helix transcriptional regulator [Bacteroidota bacterium]